MTDLLVSRSTSTFRGRCSFVLLFALKFKAIKAVRLAWDSVVPKWYWTAREGGNYLEALLLVEGTQDSVCPTFSVLVSRGNHYLLFESGLAASAKAPVMIDQVLMTSWSAGLK